MQIFIRWMLRMANSSSSFNYIGLQALKNGASFMLQQTASKVSPSSLMWKKIQKEYMWDRLGRAEQGCSICFQNTSATQLWDGGGQLLLKTAQPSLTSSPNNTKLFTVTVCFRYSKMLRSLKLKSGWFVLKLVNVAAVTVHLIVCK